MQLLFKDDEKINDELEKYQAHLDRLNWAYESYLALNIGKITLPELIKMKDYERHVKTRVYETNPSLVALPLDKEKTIAIMSLPAGYDEFARACGGINPYGQPPSSLPQLRYYSIVDDEVVLNEKTLEKDLTAQYSTYATNKEQEKLFKAGQDIYNILSKLKDEGIQIPGNFISENLSSTIYLQSPSGLRFNPHEIKYYGQPTN